MSINRRKSTDEISHTEERSQLGLQQLYPPVEEEPRPIWRWVLAAILVLIVALGMVVGAGALGYLDGTRDRDEYLRVQALEHYRLGVQHMESGEYDLAVAEFEETLRFQPDLLPAWDKLRETQMRMVTIPTPTSVPLPTLAPTPTPTETQPDKAAFLAEAQSSYEQGAYLQAVAKIEELLALDPTYEQERVKEILFMCYSEQALAWIGEDRLEEAVRLLDLALQMRPDDSRVRLERELATKYMTALTFWGADWEKASLQFAALYQLRPDYKDVSSRLFSAHVAYGDLLSEQGQWCEAAEVYKRALQLHTDETLSAKRDQMVQNCALNLPPPTAENGSGTETATQTPDGTPTTESGGLDNAELQALGLEGTLYYSIYDAALREYVVYRINADGNENVEVMAGMHQPQVNPAGTHLAARARSGVKTLGLYLIDLTSGSHPSPSLITSHVDDLYPSFSPDGQQVLFTSNRMSQRLWTLFTTWIDGQSEPRAVVQGQTPAWSPLGDRFVYKGCDEYGNNCGLYTVSPTGADLQRVVTDPSAGFAAWSPDGRQLAFMSNRDGNWEIYGVLENGQGLRRITRSKSSEGLPAWAPDGKAIAFVSDRDGKWGIYVQRLDDGRLSKLVTLDTTYEDWLIEQISWGPRLKVEASP